MIFIESPVFTADVRELLTDEEYAAFQVALAGNPERGDVISHSGGLRKIRWMVTGRGKRGGVRVIYYYAKAAQQIRLVYIYVKGVKDDLTPRELAILRKLNEGWD